MKVICLFLALVMVAVMVHGHPEHRSRRAVDCNFWKPDCFCLQYEDPVCATNGCTYFNSCRMSCGNAQLLHRGPCKKN